MDLGFHKCHPLNTLSLMSATSKKQSHQGTPSWQRCLPNLQTPNQGSIFDDSQATKSTIRQVGVRWWSVFLGSGTSFRDLMSTSGEALSAEKISFWERHTQPNRSGGLWFPEVDPDASSVVGSSASIYPVLMKLTCCSCGQFSGMWFLVGNVANAPTKIWLRAGKTYTIGRKGGLNNSAFASWGNFVNFFTFLADSDITLAGDKTVSREHAAISVAQTNQNELVSMASFSMF